MVIFLDENGFIHDGDTSLAVGIGHCLAAPSGLDQGPLVYFDSAENPVNRVYFFSLHPKLSRYKSPHLLAGSLKSKPACKMSLLVH